MHSRRKRDWDRKEPELLKEPKEKEHGAWKGEKYTPTSEEMRARWWMILDVILYLNGKSFNHFNKVWIRWGLGFEMDPSDGLKVSKGEMRRESI